MLTACHLKSVECQPRRNSGIQTFERVYIIARVTNTFASPIQQYFSTCLLLLRSLQSVT